MEDAVARAEMVLEPEEDELDEAEIQIPIHYPLRRPSQ